LKYKGQTTDGIAPTATALLLEHELEKLDSVADVRVNTHGAATVCPAHGATTSITFLRDFSRHSNQLNVTVNTTKMTSTGTIVANMKYQGQNSAMPGQTAVSSTKTTRFPKECSGRGKYRAKRS